MLRLLDGSLVASFRAAGIDRDQSARWLGDRPAWRRDVSRLAVESKRRQT
jgi:hypothetical protein